MLHSQVRTPGAAPGFSWASAYELGVRAGRRKRPAFMRRGKRCQQLAGRASACLVEVYRWPAAEVHSCPPHAVPQPQPVPNRHAMWLHITGVLRHQIMGNQDAHKGREAVAHCAAPGPPCALPPGPQSVALTDPPLVTSPQPDGMAAAAGAAAAAGLPSRLESCHRAVAGRPPPQAVCCPASRQGRPAAAAPLPRPAPPPRQLAPRRAASARSGGSATRCWLLCALPWYCSTRRDTTPNSSRTAATIRVGSGAQQQASSSRPSCHSDVQCLCAPSGTCQTELTAGGAPNVLSNSTHNNTPGGKHCTLQKLLCSTHLRQRPVWVLGHAAQAVHRDLPAAGKAVQPLRSVHMQERSCRHGAASCNGGACSEATEGACCRQLTLG